MARNGSGTFIRLYSWEQDAANNIRIRADRMDNEMDGMADALTGSIASDGQTPITANLPMSGWKHTNVADATQRNQYATWGQAQDNTAQWGGTDTGDADAYEITTTPVTTSYVTGQTFRFVVGAGHTNTGAATLSVNGLNTRDLKDLDGNDPAAGAIRAGGLYEAVYDGTNFVVTGYVVGTAFGQSLFTAADAAAAGSVLGLGDYVLKADQDVNIEYSGDGGLIVRTDNNDGSFIFEVRSSGGAVRFGVDHGAPEMRGASGGWTINGNSVVTDNEIGTAATFDRGTGSNQIPTNSQINFDVAGDISGFSAGQVGSYALAGRGTTSVTNFGETLAGSQLSAAGARFDNADREAEVVFGGSLSGTWRCMGLLSGAGSANGALTLFLRIS